jgi:hypothetical protein
MMDTVFEGGCTCGAVRYRMNRRPMIVHCCHCRWCQRESGSAFALNGMIEASELGLIQGDVEIVDIPSNSGRGQAVSRCPECRIALWSNYAGAKGFVHFVKIGTLDNPDEFPPDIHIFTASKQPWVNLEGGAPVVAEYYKAADYWSGENMARYRRALGK